jgi:hypothetical protein
MQILIEKDAATKVPKEVADVAEARSFVAQGFVVHQVNDDGSLSPLPEDAPAEEAPKAKRRKAEG